MPRFERAGSTSAISNGRSTATFTTREGSTRPAVVELRNAPDQRSAQVLRRTDFSEGFEHRCKTAGTDAIRHPFVLPTPASGVHAVSPVPRQQGLRWDFTIMVGLRFSYDHRPASQVSMLNARPRTSENSQIRRHDETDTTKNQIIKGKPSFQ